jgi:hypothetical protein
MEINDIICKTITYNSLIVVKINEFSVVPHTDIVYMCGYCDGV